MTQVVNQNSITTPITTSSTLTTSPSSTSSTLPRWLPRFMYKSSSLVCRQSSSPFTVPSLTKVHTFGKLKQQSNNNNNNSKSNLGMSGFNNNSNTSRNKSQQRQRILHPKAQKLDETYNDSSKESILFLLPIELINDICSRLDCFTLYQLTLTSSYCRYLLQRTSRYAFSWRTLVIDPSLPIQDHPQKTLYKMICFLVTNGLHTQVEAVIMNGCPFLDTSLLDTMTHAFPNLVRLSLTHCPQIDCWKILHMLRSVSKKNHELLHARQSDYNKQHHRQCQSSQQQQQQEEEDTDLLLASLKKIKHHPQRLNLFSKTISSDTNAMSSSTSDTDSTFSPSHGFFSQMGSHLQHRSSSSSSSSSTTNNHDDNSNYLFPCLQHLTQLDIEGAFPSERSYKSYGHEMYCFGEIKKVLLQFGKKENNESIDAATAQQQQLSEGHYALYQFWLLLRSHMLRGDGLLLQQDQPQDNDHRERVASLDPHQQHSRQQIDLRRDFRPAWLPDSLVQFIQITEQDDPSSSVKIDLIACPLCSRNVASSSSGLASRSTTTTKTCIDRVPCHVCQNLTPMVCAQCRCHACHAVLCRRCHQLHQSRLRQSQQRQRQQQQLQRQQGQRSEGRIHQRHQDSMRTTTSRSVNSVSRTVVTATRIEESSSASTNHEAHKDALSSWHVLRCHQCHLLKQTCGRPSCVNMENKYHHHHHQKWICATCQQQKWIKQQRKSTSRFFKKSRHWSHWI